jgi:hypothetical protein
MINPILPRQGYIGMLGVWSEKTTLQAVANAIKAAKDASKWCLSSITRVPDNAGRHMMAI